MCNTTVTSSHECNVTMLQGHGQVSGSGVGRALLLFPFQNNWELHIQLCHWAIWYLNFVKTFLLGKLRPDTDIFFTYSSNIFSRLENIPSCRNVIALEDNFLWKGNTQHDYFSTIHFVRTGKALQLSVQRYKMTLQHVKYASQFSLTNFSVLSSLQTLHRLGSW